MRQGLYWLREGFLGFFKQPLALGSLFLMCSMALLVVAILPYVGPPMSLMLTPCASFGMLAAVGEARAKRMPTPMLLIEGLRGSVTRRRDMLRLGLLFAGCMLLLSIVCLSGVDLTEVAKADGTLDLEALQKRPDIRIAFLLVSVGSMPLIMVFTHAAALVYWNRMKTLQALGTSAMAIVRNLPAYALWLACMLVALVATSNLVAYAAHLLDSGPLFVAMVFPVSIAIACVGIGGLFQAFVDCHPPPAPAPTEVT